ncbi:GGDEF domain-containing protein [Vibrio cholerae]
MNDDFHQLSNSHFHNEKTKKLTNGYITINNDLYLIVVGPFIDESNYQPRENGFLAIGIKMDNDYILHLAKKYNLGHLSVVPTTHVVSKDEESMILLSPTGTPVAKILWRPNLPSTAVLPNITLVIMLFSLVAIIVTRVILLAEEKNRASYENKIYLEATRDSLTNVSNRRHFMEQAGKEFASARKNNERFFVLVLDLDHFKAINDTFGHKSGDKALVHFVHLCEQHLSERDIFGRIGGEEFALILSRYSRSHAMYKAFAIRKTVMENPMQEKHHSIQMTVSIGVAECTTQTTLDELLEEADKAMYQAKHAGRNQVIQL